MGSTGVVDAVTLQHFAAAGRLDVLQELLYDCDPPFWTGYVREEILIGSGIEHCDDVLSAGFLGVPIDGDASATVAMHTRIAGFDEPDKHWGEAESIVVADERVGIFITDDALAYDFAQRRLGDARVFDTVELLHRGVHHGVMSAADALLIANHILNCGRHLRAGHPETLTVEYFS